MILNQAQLSKSNFTMSLVLGISLLSPLCQAEDSVVINQTASSESSIITILQTQEDIEQTGNTIEITQGDGGNNSLLASQHSTVDSETTITQEGSGNQLSTEQIATIDSTIMVNEIGNNNIVEIIQAYITNGQIDVSIDGNANNVEITQGAEGYYSSDNAINYAAIGNDNTAILEQYGSKNSIDLTQGGDGNTANIQQYGSGHNFELVQEGDNGLIDICQGDECT